MERVRETSVRMCVYACERVCASAYKLTVRSGRARARVCVALCSVCPPFVPKMGAVIYFASIYMVAFLHIYIYYCLMF